MTANAVYPDITNAFVNPVHTKINALDKIVVSHSEMKTAIEGITDCISWTASSKEPRGAVLVGAGGTGKTTICNTIINRFPSREFNNEYMITRIVPAFYTSVPSPSSIKSLAANMLDRLGDPTPQRGTAYSLTARLCKLLEVCQTKVIFLDEFHHLLAEASAGDRLATKVCNWLKTLINQTGVMICIVGTPECEGLVNFDEQLARRFAHRYQLKELDAGTPSEPGPLSNFLLALSKQFVAKLGLAGMVDFRDHWHASQMWAATSGIPAFVVLLLKEASAIALNAGRNTVVLSDLEDAFERGITRSAAITSGNPFAMSNHMLAAQINGTKLK